MGYFKDFYDWHLTIRKRHWPRELLRLRNYTSVYKWRRQRANRGWSNSDVWNGGEYLAEVAAGILYDLHKQQVDWDDYFKMNYEDTFGYHSLEEVADDLQLYVEWDQMQFSEPLYSEIEKLGSESRWSMDIQVYEQAKNAMHFVAANLGGLWW